MLTIDQLKALLKEQICTVVFEKKDKTHRQMRCTLMTSYLNQHDLQPTGGGHSYPVEQIRVVDVDKNEWRSFKLDSVLFFE